MKSSQPPFWHQGLFLQPQHLQYADLHHADHTISMTRLCMPHLWGTASLDLNEEALNNQLLEVESGTFLFPDGTLVTLHDNAILPSRSFSQEWTDPHTSLMVHLGIRRLQDDGANVTTVAGASKAAQVNSRFVTIQNDDQMNDLHQSGPATQIKRLSYVLRLFWNSELNKLDDWITIPLAQLVIDGDRVRPAPNYIAPCIQLSASDVLTRMVKGVRDELSGRARQLEEYKTPAGASNSGDLRAVRYRMALQTLARYTPVLYHYLETQAVHPWHVYSTLRQLVGELSIFSERIDMLGETLDGEQLLKPYDPYTLSTSFGNAARAISQLLNEITVGPELLVMLEQAEAGSWRGSVGSDFLDQGSSFYLVLRTERSFDELLDSFLSFAKFGSAGEVPIFIQRSLPGVPLRHLKSQPEGLPRRPNSNYFRISMDNSAWGAVAREFSVMLHWDDAPEDLRVELVTVRR